MLRRNRWVSAGVYARRVDVQAAPPTAVTAAIREPEHRSTRRRAPAPTEGTFERHIALTASQPGCIPDARGAPGAPRRLLAVVGEASANSSDFIDSREHAAPTDKSNADAGQRQTQASHQHRKTSGTKQPRGFQRG